MARPKEKTNIDGSFSVKMKYRRVIESDSNLMVKPKFLTVEFISRFQNQIIYG